MKRLDLWKAKLKAAEAEQRIRIRERSAADRTVVRLETLIIALEGKIHAYLAKS